MHVVIMKKPEFRLRKSNPEIQAFSFDTFCYKPFIITESIFRDLFEHDLIEGPVYLARRR